MLKAARVSIVMPCFNQARFLNEAIASLTAQTIEDWECIIVNDGSTDETQDLAVSHSKRDDRIRYVSQANRGLSAARNTGLSHCRGGLVQFLDCDDKLERSKLATQCCFLDDNPGVGLVYGDARYFISEEPESYFFSLFRDVSEPWIPNLWNSGRPVLDLLVNQNIMPVNSPLLRRSVIEKTGSFDESLKALEDWDYWVRCAARGVRFEYLAPSGSLALIRSHPASMSRDRGRMLRGLLDFRLRFARHVRDPQLRLENLLLAKSILNQVPRREAFHRCMHLAWESWSLKTSAALVERLFRRMLRRRASSLPPSKSPPNILTDTCAH